MGKREMTSLPTDPGAFRDATELARAVEEALRDAPLTGPKETAVKEVMEWARSCGIDPESAEALPAYNEAAASVPTELKQLLGRYAEHEDLRAALISLLGSSGTGDDARVLILDALEPNVSAIDVGELARLNLKQRPRVLYRALEVIAATGCGEALFALEKAYGKLSGEPGRKAPELAGNLRLGLLEAEVLTAAIAGRTKSASAQDLDESELLYCCLALSAEQQWKLKSGPLGTNLLKQISKPAIDLDADLRERAKEASSLHPYYMHVRDELHELALITGVPEDKELRGRAVEHLFRRDDLSDIEELAAYLPENILRQYVSRALTKENRRGKRADRAEFALELLQRSSPEFRSEFRSIAAECLDESNDRLKAEAARTLARDHSALPTNLTAKLSRAYDEMPTQLQEELAADLGAVVGGQPLTLDSLLRLVAGAPDDEVEPQLRRLLTRWAAEPRLSLEDVAQVMEVVGQSITRLSDDQRKACMPDVVETAAGWLHARGRQIVEPSRILLRWRRFREIVFDYFDAFAKRLRADQARGLLSEAVGPYADASPEIFERLAGIQLDAEREDRILSPVLLEAVGSNPRSADAAFKRVAEQPQRRLLIAGLLTERAAQERIADLNRALDAGATEALLTQRQAVLEALQEAEAAGKGNERLLELFRDIRETIGAFGVDTGQEEQTDAPSDGVQEWRAEAAKRSSGVVKNDSKGGGLSPRKEISGHADEAARLVGELDKRVHSPRVVPLADRRHYRNDLVALIRAMAAQGMLDEIEPQNGASLARVLESGAPDLQALVWKEWANRSGRDEETDLTVALADADSGRSEGQMLFRLEAVVACVESDDIRRTVNSLPIEDLSVGWSRLQRLLIADLRKVGELEQREKRQETTIGDTQLHA